MQELWCYRSIQLNFKEKPDIIWQRNETSNTRGTQNPKIDLTKKIYNATNFNQDDNVAKQRKTIRTFRVNTQLTKTKKIKIKPAENLKAGKAQGGAFQTLKVSNCR